MEIETINQNSYIVLQIKEDLSPKSDLTVLKDQIKAYLDSGSIKIALSFTEKSYFHTQTISALVQCVEYVNEKGGKLAIINPNAEIRDVLDTISLDKLVDVFPSIESIGK